MTLSGPDLAVEHLTIGAYRGLRNLELPGLERVNLFIGSGNSGKTSILEALKLYTAPLSLREWLSVGRLREARGSVLYPTQAVDVLRWMFPHAHDEVSSEEARLAISGSGACKVRSLNATCQHVSATRRLTEKEAQDLTVDLASDYIDAEDARVIEDEGWQFDLRAKWADMIEPLYVSFTAWNHGPGSLPADGAEIPSQMLAPYAHRNQPEVMRALTKSIIDDEKKEIEALLHDLDPNVLGIEILADSGSSNAYVALRHKHAGVAPITVFGDGIRRALMIAAAVQQTRGGLLMLDEIEAALHVSALDKMFPWLERACVKFDVQVFATTHSLEAIDAIAKSAQGEGLAAYHVGSEDSLIKRYSAEMLQRLVHDRGLDIR